MQTHYAKKLGFNTQKYLAVQVKAINDRVRKFGGKLFLEFGGKLCYDHHASRVLPGFDFDTKIKILRRLKEKSEIIYCVSAKDVQRRKIRRDFGLTYDDQTLKDINDLKERGLEVSCVIITRFDGEESAKKFKRRLENHGIKAYFHYEIKWYPNDIERVVSEKGYGHQKYIKTKKPLVVVTGPGPGSGKMSFCLSQIYHDRKVNIKSGFAKFETFPIWNLPLNHPVNVAYEAATADIGDVIMVDPFHLQAYKLKAVN